MAFSFLIEFLFSVVSFESTVATGVLSLFSEDFCSILILLFSIFLLTSELDFCPDIGIFSICPGYIISPLDNLLRVSILSTVTL